MPRGAVLGLVVYVKIGQTRKSERGLVDLLLDCHERIRSFTALAMAVGERRDLPEADVVDGCARVERYFVEALPLHEADEEESVLPRLRKRSPELDRALETMRAQHTEHHALVRALLGAAQAAGQQPGDGARRAALAAAAGELGLAFERHLELEERVILPALRELPEAEQAAITRELRARRAPQR